MKSDKIHFIKKDEDYDWCLCNLIMQKTNANSTKSINDVTCSKCLKILLTKELKV